MLQIKEIDVSYVDIPVLYNISLQVKEKQIVSIIGSNGVGKSTLLKTISGIVKPKRGKIIFNGKRIDDRPSHEIVSMGIAHVPEGRRLFSRLSVIKNLYLGAYSRKSEHEIEQTLDYIFDIFPILNKRKNQKAATLSGGEQQLLAISRGLMLEPKFMMLDEPSLGLMPRYISKVFDVIKKINNKGVTILLVEQNIRKALKLADYAYVLQNGRIVLEGKPEELLESDLVRKAYLGL